MSAQAVIDPIEQTLRLGEHVWRFDWDPSSATAAIQLDDRTYDLNVVSWRQKCNLARALSRVAAMPLERMLLRASLHDRAPLPHRADEREALIALCLWLNDSPSPLPWHPATLAQATLDVCRASAIAPRDLDDLPAVEVEELWQAVATRAAASGFEAGAAETPSRTVDGVKRIVVMPDPPMVSTESAAMATPEDSDAEGGRLSGSGPVLGRSRLKVERQELDVRNREPHVAGPVTGTELVSASERLDSTGGENVRPSAPPTSPESTGMPSCSRRFRISASTLSSGADHRGARGTGGDPRARRPRHVPAEPVRAEVSRRDESPHAQTVVDESTPAPPERPSTPRLASERVGQRSQSPQPEWAPLLRGSAAPSAAAEQRSRSAGDLAATPLTVRRAHASDPLMPFIEDEPIEPAASNIDTDRHWNDDELARAAVEAGIDEV